MNQETAKAHEEIIWIENLARMMDSKFTIPGTKFKFGLDPIIGLIPVIGDITTLVISGFLVMSMAKYGVSRKVVILMTLNVLIDTTLGGIPVIGNIFDFFYKSNQKNIRLLKEHYGEGKHHGSGNGIIIGIILFILLLTAIMIFAFYKLIQFLINLW
jgi:hypothetical protein